MDLTGWSREDDEHVKATMGHGRSSESAGVTRIGRPDNNGTGTTYHLPCREVKDTIFS